MANAMLATLSISIAYAMLATLAKEDKSLLIALTSTLQTSSDLNNYNNNKYENICIINNYVSHL